MITAVILLLIKETMAAVSHFYGALHHEILYREIKGLITCCQIQDP